MKINSLSRLLKLSFSSFKRFPEVIILSIIGTIAMLFFIEYEHKSIKIDWLVNLIHTCVLGISLLTGVKLLTERLNLKQSWLYLIRLIPIIFLILFYFTLPKETTQLILIRSLLLGISFHCFVAVAPYFRSGESNGFWHFNRSLFQHIALSVLYSGVLYIGIVFAMLAMDNLFGHKFSELRYFELWVVLIGIFNTWFFLSGVPSDYEALENNDEYPRGLKIFTQYVLLPLVALYLIILYAYLFKIGFRMTLPVGWVSVLILSFSIAGILSLLLVHPLRESANETWLKAYTKWFYRLQFPLIGLLFVAIGKRLSDYGITEERYFIVVLACWLLGITIYFLFKRQKLIRNIPITLGLLALLSAFGPWSSFSVSRENQLSRLKNYLTKENLLVNGIWIKSNKIINVRNGEEINSTLTYLTKVHDYHCIQPLVDIKLDSLFKNSESYYYASKLLDTLGLKTLNNLSTYVDQGAYYSFEMPIEDQKVIRMDGYKYVMQLNNVNPVSLNQTENSTNCFKIENDTLFFRYDLISSSLVLKYKNDSSLIHLKPLVEVNSTEPVVKFTKDDLTFVMKTSTYEIKFNLLNFNYNYNQKTKLLTTNNMSAIWFFKFL